MEIENKEVETKEVKIKVVDTNTPVMVSNSWAIIGCASASARTVDGTPPTPPSFMPCGARTRGLSPFLPLANFVRRGGQ